MMIQNYSTHNLEIEVVFEDGTHRFILMPGEKSLQKYEYRGIRITDFKDYDSSYDVGLKLKDERIAALEATLEKICYSFKINSVVCNDCHSYSETKEAIVHAPNCFFMQVQKELGEE